jgi:hypothetical protein
LPIADFQLPILARLQKDKLAIGNKKEETTDVS